MDGFQWGKARWGGLLLDKGWAKNLPYQIILALDLRAINLMEFQP